MPHTPAVIVLHHYAWCAIHPPCAALPSLRRLARLPARRPIRPCDLGRRHVMARPEHPSCKAVGCPFVHSRRRPRLPSPLTPLLPLQALLSRRWRGSWAVLPAGRVAAEHPGAGGAGVVPAPGLAARQPRLCSVCQGMCSAAESQFLVPCLASLASTSPLPCAVCSQVAVPTAPRLLPSTLQYYDFPSPSLRNALYPLMQADVAPFKVRPAAERKALQSWEPAAAAVASPGSSCRRTADTWRGATGLPSMRPGLVPPTLRARPHPLPPPLPGRTRAQGWRQVLGGGQAAGSGPQAGCQLPVP